MIFDEWRRRWHKFLVGTWHRSINLPITVLNLKILSVAVFCLIAIVAAIAPAEAEKANKAGDAEIEKKLEQIVALRVRVLEEQRLLAAEGRRAGADVSLNSSSPVPVPFGPFWSFLNDSR